MRKSVAMLDEVQKALGLCEVVLTDHEQYDDWQNNEPSAETEAVMSVRVVKPWLEAVIDQQREVLGPL